MYNRKKSAVIRAAAMLLVMALAFPVGVSAAVVETVQPRASDYLNSYNAYIHTAGGGKIQVYFSVIGTDYMDSLGALRISIYESADNNTWTLKSTHTNVSTPSLLGYDDYFYASNVDYYGVAGRYYKAYVCIWAGKNGSGDTRYFWTSAKKAT